MLLIKKFLYFSSQFSKVAWNSDKAGFCTADKSKASLFCTKEYKISRIITVSGAERARELAKKLGPINMPAGNDNRLLTTLTGNYVIDNHIELHTS